MGLAVTPTTRLVPTLWAVVLAAAPICAQQPPAPSRPADPPIFRASTELIAIDASVVDSEGAPIADLTTDDFVLTIDGTPRRIVQAQFIRQDPPRPPAALSGRRLSFSTNEAAVGGRLILFVFDLEGIGAGGGRGAVVAASRFVDQLAPADRVGVLAFPNGATADFTADRDAAKKALMQVVGRGSVFANGTYNIGLSEAYDIDRGDVSAYVRVVQRECANEFSREGLVLCRTSLESQSRSMAMENRQRAQNALQTLRRILVALAQIDAPKTLVWISEGLPLAEDRIEIGGMASMALAARTTIYSLHLDQTLGADASRGHLSPTMLQDRQLETEGLALIAGITRGAMFTSIGSGSELFDRLAREMAAYYLLSAEPMDSDRDGKPHRIRLQVNRRNASVRARREFILRPQPPVSLTPEQRLSSVLGQPLPATELPIKVATYSLRSPGLQTVRVVATAEFGRTAAEPEDASMAYAVVAPDGKTVGTSFSTNRATPVRSDGTGRLQATTIFEIPPGRYTLRLAVVDAGGRTGSVEHPLDASIAAAGPVELADLLLAPAGSGGNSAVRLVADPTIDDEPFGAYLEIYPRADDVVRQVKVMIEIADGETAPAIAAVEAPIAPTGERGRFIAQAMLPLALVPPGDYVARAVVTTPGGTAARVRPFRLARAQPAGPTRP